jgi:aminopeptidase N
VAENSFRDTAAILAFFEKETGVKFPWAKYYSVCVTDFVAGGMENTSMTTLTTNTLFSADSENLRSSHQLDAHEVAHQWFGNLLTCKDWSHLWLNEGFATYYTHLYDAEKSGSDEMLYQLHTDGRQVIDNPDEKPIVWRGYVDPFEQFDYRAYPKGGWVLHMLRSQVGPELFRKTITTYLERHRNSSVVTQDLLAVFEETTGRSWDEFFDQWVFHGVEPLLKVAYAWDQERGQAKLTIQQTQKTSDKVLLFDFPLPVRFVDEKGTVSDFSIRIHEASEDFYFTLPAKPAIVRIDPDLTVLTSIDLALPNAMLYAQLERGDDMMGRLLAAKALGGKNDSESLKRLQKTLTGDPFYGVRIEAARALAKTRTPESLAVLLASTTQDDARARQELVAAIGKFYTPEAFTALSGVVASEKNPDIVVTALGALSAYLQGEASPVLLAALERESYRHRIAAAAISGLRSRGEESVADPLMEHMRKNEARFTTGDFGRALDSLAYLVRTRDDKGRAGTQQFIAGYLDHPKENLRRAAIGALGTLDDRRSLGALQTFVDAGDPDSPESKSATDAIRKITAAGGQAGEVKDLRRELLELQKELKTVRDGLETVKKQTAPAPPAEKAKE